MLAIGAADIMPVVAGIVFILVGLALFGPFVLGAVLIQERQVGIVVKRFGGRSLPPGQLIALAGESGYQADTLAPGLELLRKLLNNEIKVRSKKFLMQSKSFAELLENSIRKYQNRAIETAQVIEELIQLAKEMRQADKRGKNLGLSQEEVAFYDALETNDSAVKALGDDNLKFIAQELVKTIHANVTIDWTAKESVRAKLRVMVKKVLRRFGYPPDKQEKATQTVLQQAELLCADWVE
jgi:hypothetical protein